MQDLECGFPRISLLGTSVNTIQRQLVEGFFTKITHFGDLSHLVWCYRTAVQQDPENVSEGSTELNLSNREENT
jgi:hypothetical protein